MKKTPSIIRILFVAAFAFSLLVPAYAQTAAAQSAIVELDVNGMKVLIKRRPGTPTVAAGLFFRGGSRNLTAANAGIESFALTVASEATKNYPRQKLRKEIARMGTNVSSGSNYDYSAISLASTKTNFETSWKIFVDVALNPTFAADDVERLRETRLTGLRAIGDSPENLLEDLNDKTIYTGHPYANSPDGTLETIAKFKSSDLAAYHKSLLETSRMLLVVVGDVEVAALQKEIEAAFGKLPRGSYKAETVTPLNFTKGTLDITSKSLQTDYVKGTFAAPSLKDPDYYAMRTAITILQQNVFQEVRVKRNLSYAPDADLRSIAANTGAISVSSVNPNEAVRAMLGEIQKLQQHRRRRGVARDHDHLGLRSQHRRCLDARPFRALRKGGVPRPALRARRLQPWRWPAFRVRRVGRQRHPRRGRGGRRAQRGRVRGRPGARRLQHGRPRERLALAARERWVLSQGARGIGPDFGPVAL